MGFLDGRNGFIIAANQSYYTFLKHMKLLFLLKKVQAAQQESS
jgi:hypothetical protein